jgi:hypothetical protein
MCSPQRKRLESGDDLRKPLARFGDWPVHVPAHLLLDLRSFKQVAVVTRLRQLADELDAFSDARDRLSIGRAVLRLDLNLAAQSHA